jgi:hypothetical protein
MKNDLNTTKRHIWLFIDHEKALDHIIRPKLWKVPIQRGFSAHFNQAKNFEEFLYLSAF